MCWRAGAIRSLLPSNRMEMDLKPSERLDVFELRFLDFGGDPVAFT